MGEILLYNEQHLGLFFVKNGKNLGFGGEKFTQKAPKRAQKSEVIFYDETLGKALHDKACELNALLKSYSKIALYGAGAHGNTIITYLDSANLDKIALCFDLDTRKQGRFLQDSNIVIKKPCNAEFTGLECVLISSPLYEKEVCEFLRKEGFKGDIIISQKALRVIKA